MKEGNSKRSRETTVLHCCRRGPVRAPAVNVRNETRHCVLLRQGLISPSKKISILPVCAATSFLLGTVATEPVRIPCHCFPSFLRTYGLRSYRERQSSLRVADGGHGVLSRTRFLGPGKVLLVRSNGIRCFSLPTTTSRLALSL